MQFRTELLVFPGPSLLHLHSKVVTIGSCFAEVIGNKMADHKLEVLVNPFGTLFNPISQFELIEAALHPEEQEEMPMVEHNGIWYSYSLHSQFSATSKSALQDQIDQTLQQVRVALLNCNLLIFTFGTAWVYQLNDNDRIVANCHKMPAALFDKKLLQTEEITSRFVQALALLRQYNPAIQIALTVSPVRHIKDTLPLNSVSKSVLRLACHYLSEMLPQVQYFPAYELMIDDLRDYRFYKDDLLHPTEMAEEYVWQKFKESYFSGELKAFAREWAKIRQSLQHRSFHPASAVHQAFLQRLLQQLEQVHQFTDCSSEIQQVKEQLLVIKPKSRKRVSPELMKLLQNLAASEVMIEENTMSAPKPSTSFDPEIALSESFLPDSLPAKENSGLMAEPQPEMSQQPDIEAEPQVSASEVINSKQTRRKTYQNKRNTNKPNAKAVAKTNQQTVIAGEDIPSQNETKMATVPSQSTAQKRKPQPKAPMVNALLSALAGNAAQPVAKQRQPRKTATKAMQKPVPQVVVPNQTQPTDTSLQAQEKQQQKSKPENRREGSQPKKGRKKTITITRKKTPGNKAG